MPAALESKCLNPDNIPELVYTTKGTVRVTGSNIPKSNGHGGGGKLTAGGAGGRGSDCGVAPMGVSDDDIAGGDFGGGGSSDGDVDDGDGSAASTSSPTNSASSASSSTDSASRSPSSPDSPGTPDANERQVAPAFDGAVPTGS
ncbi:unnamed protein product [Ectocarpus sp. 6 AP-2014]